MSDTSFRTLRIDSHTNGYRATLFDYPLRNCSWTPLRLHARTGALHDERQIQSHALSEIFTVAYDALQIGEFNDPFTACSKTFLNSINLLDYLSTSDTRRPIALHTRSPLVTAAVPILRALGPRLQVTITTSVHYFGRAGVKRHMETAKILKDTGLHVTFRRMESTYEQWLLSYMEQHPKLRAIPELPSSRKRPHTTHAA